MIPNSISAEPSQMPLPLTLRLKLILGKPLGFFFVPENYVRTIYREGRYWDARGPGLVRYDWWSETLGTLVYTSGQFSDYTLQNLLTRDVVPVTIRLQAIVAFDPSATKRDIARILTTLPRHILKGVAEPYLRWAMMEAVNRHDATELGRHDVLAQIADELAPKVTNEMRFLGMQITAKVKLLEVRLPQTLAERQEMIAQRRASILAGEEYHPAEVRRALVTEVLERMGQDGIGNSLINFDEFLESYAETKAGKSSRPTIDVTPQPALSAGGSPTTTTSMPASQPVLRRRKHHV